MHVSKSTQKSTKWESRNCCHCQIQSVNRYNHLKSVKLEEKDTKDLLPLHLILGTSDYAKIKTRTAPKIGKIGEPIAELTTFGWTIMSSGEENDLTSV